MTSITEKVVNGNKRAIARLITLVENNHPNTYRIIDSLYAHTGRAHLVGVTGSPGTGKSSLVNKLAKSFRQQDKSVAIIAVDPTSPFSGGAILGDRIRMRELSGDQGIFIRSMASRGNLGGLARAVDNAINVLDAADYEVILIETVGAGQGEVDIAKIAHTTIVVEAPGLGDDVQAIKAGILEIADIFVVNKADRPGVERTVATLKAMLELGNVPTHQMLHHGQLVTIESVPNKRESLGTNGWKIPVLQTSAIKEEGIEAVTTAINQHLKHLKESGEMISRTRTRLLDELENILQTELMSQLLRQLPEGYLSKIVDNLATKSLSPYAAAEQIMKESIKEKAT